MSKDIFKRVFSCWHWYLFVLQWTFVDQNFYPYSTPFSLYLKAKSNLYSVVQINTLPTIATAISIVTAFCSGLVADKTGRFWLPTALVTIPVLISISMLVAWDLGESHRLAAFMIMGFESGTSFYKTSLHGKALTGVSAVSPMTTSWASVIMANDAEERAVVTASMNAIGQAVAAGVQVVQWPTTSAPDFRAGFQSVLGTTIAQLIMIFVILYMSATEMRQIAVNGRDRVVEAVVEVEGKDV
jgi:MFS transporter, ACS family, pantothenate transporter